MSGSDVDMLRLWKQSGDADAFSELVRRYAGLVYAACLRVLGNPADAEDVTQECFLELATRPPAVHSTLGGWLHRTATNRALNHARAAQRRRDREQRFAQAHPASTITEWDDIEGYIDEAIAALSPRLRDVVLLTYLRGLTQDEAARRLDIAPRTVRYRQQRAIDAIRGSLRRKGVLAPTGLAALLTANMAAAQVPESLQGRLGRIALSGVVPKASVATLIAVGVRSIGAWKLAAVSVLLVALSAAMLVYGPQEAVPVIEEPVVAESPPASMARAPIVDAPQTEVNASVAAPTPQPAYRITGEVRDPDGVPVPGAIIQQGEQHHATTDAQGRFAIEDVSNGDSWFVVKAQGFEWADINRAFTQWNGPMHVTAMLHKNSVNEQIRVLDTKHQPVVGATVRPYQTAETLAVTDADGFFTVPPLFDRCVVQHPDLGSALVAMRYQDTVYLTPPTQLTAKVTWQGRPIPEARVTWRDPRLRDLGSLSTDPNGTATTDDFFASGNETMMNARWDRPGTTPVYGMTPVRPEPGNPTSCEILLEDRLIGTVQGRLLWDDGTPVEGGQVRAMSLANPHWSVDAELSMDGQFRLPLFKGENIVGPYELSHAWMGAFDGKFAVSPGNTEFHRDLKIRRQDSQPVGEYAKLFRLDHQDRPHPERLLIVTNTSRIRDVRCWIPTPEDNLLRLTSTAPSSPGSVIVADATHDFLGVWRGDGSDPNALQTPPPVIALDIPVMALEGSLVDARGKPVAYGTVDCACEGAAYRVSTQSDAQGQFTLWPVAADNTVEFTAYAEDTDQTRLRTRVSRGARPLRLTLNRRDQILAGSVVYEDGSPVADGSILCRPSDNAEGKSVETSIAYGKFEAKVSGGTYTLTARDGLASSEPVIATAPNANIVLVLPGGIPRTEDITMEQRANNYKQLGIVFKMFSNESKENVFPALSRVPGTFSPELSAIYPEYLTDSNIAAQLAGETGVGSIYLGYMVSNETEGMAFLDAYETLGPETMYNQDVQVGEGQGSLGGDTLLRIYERLEVDDPSPTASAQLMSEMPVLWELPSPHPDGPIGGYVLFQDGHVEWLKYPSKFPMTEAFMTRLQELRQQ